MNDKFALIEEINGHRILLTIGYSDNIDSRYEVYRDLVNDSTNGQGQIYKVPINNRSIEEVLNDNIYQYAEDTAGKINLNKETEEY